MECVVEISFFEVLHDSLAADFDHDFRDLVPCKGGVCAEFDDGEDLFGGEAGRYHGWIYGDLTERHRGFECTILDFVVSTWGRNRASGGCKRRRLRRLG